MFTFLKLISLKMINAHCIYCINYQITTQKRVPDVALMCPIVIKKQKKNKKTTTLSRFLPCYAALSVVFSLPVKVFRLQILTYLLVWFLIT